MDSVFCAVAILADRHLFALAFAIAAQYETLGKGTPATKYYLDALEHNLRDMKGTEKDRNHVVTLDRIAQSYENRCLFKVDCPWRRIAHDSVAF